MIVRYREYTEPVFNMNSVDSSYLQSFGQRNEAHWRGPLGGVHLGLVDKAVPMKGSFAPSVNLLQSPQTLLPGLNQFIWIYKVGIKALI